MLKYVVLLQLLCHISSEEADEPTSAANADLITNLPGLGYRPKFKQYSGYLKASDKHFLHYWFVESQNNPKTDPLVLWMNGGPGCSSLDGFLSELGPFHVKPDAKTLYDNPYSWNKVANVIFLEAPAGVGFSYSTEPDDFRRDDDQTSLENYNALKEFFARFPEYRNRDFYITGESYGGIYVPTLAVRFLEGMRAYPVKLKGVAIGNGMLDYRMNTNTLMEFGYAHGLIDQHMWELLEKACCNGCGDTCDFTNVSRSCAEKVGKIQHSIMDTGLNMYDLYRDCYNPGSSAFQYTRYLYDLKMALSEIKDFAQDAYNIYKQLHYDRLTQGVGMDVPCLNDSAVTSYLNQADVRSALHVAQQSGEWSVCSESIGAHYTTIYHNMQAQMEKIRFKGLRILVYNGDTDMACNFLMGQQFSERHAGKLVAAKRPWMVNRQIAGFVTQYKDWSYVTVKGAGHMVPQWRPPQALEMIKTFLNNEEW